MERILYGKPIADELDNKSKLAFKSFENFNERKPKLTAVTVGDNPASLLYVSRKEEKAIELGVEFNWIELDKDTSQEELNLKVEKAAKDSDGIIIQLPLPEHINPEQAINMIPYNLDVDGLTALNLGNLYSENYKIIPATSLAILELIKFYKIDTVDKNIVIAGRSRLVSSPLAKILSSKKYDSNVTVIHSKTTNQKEFIANADIFISAIGKPLNYDISFFKENSTVLDVGISTVDKKTYGDIDTNNLDNHLSARSPYPGGIGPITVSALYSNLAKLIS
tara:strand:- start:369 stop:1205 length:837 start_codon:yes stop_codon:yes gene_type:complete